MSKLALERDFGYVFFDDIVDWVGGNLSPHDVFDEKELEAFCKEWTGVYFNPEDVFSESILNVWAKDNNFVEDIYDEYYLMDWAETNGYIKETEA